MRTSHSRALTATTIIAAVTLLVVALLWPGDAPVVKPAPAASRTAESTDTRSATSAPTVAPAIKPTPFRGDTRPGNTARLTIKTVSQERMRPVAGVGLTARIERPDRGLTLARGTTDEAGVWVLTVETPCSVLVSLSRGDQHDSVAIAAGQTEAELVMHLPWDNDVNGTVLNASGSPVANAIIVEHASPDLGVAVATTDALGTFHLSCVRPWVHLSAWYAREGTSEASDIGVAPTAHPTFRLRGGSGVALEIRAADGLLVDAEVWLGFTNGGLPPPQNAIFWTPMRSPGGAVSSAWPPGQLHYRVRGPGTAEASGTLALAPNETAKHVITLSGEAMLEGVVLNEAGAPVEGATISAAVYNSPARAQTTSDVDGAFRLVAAEGAVNVSAWLNDGWPDSLKLPAGARTPLTFRLFTGPPLRVSVVDEAMRPLVGAPVAGTRERDGSVQARRGTTDADGIALVPRLRAGPMRVSARGPSSPTGRPAPVSTTVAPDATEIQLVMPAQPLGTVSGRVADRRTRFMELTSGETKHSSHFPVVDGAFKSPAVPPGDYALIRSVGIVQGCVAQPVHVDAGRDTDVGILEGTGVGLVKVILDGDPLAGEMATISFVSTVSDGRKLNRMVSADVGYTATSWPIELPPGKWGVSVRGPRLLPSSGSIVLQADASLTVTLPVAAGVPTSVRITFASPDDAVDCQLSLDDSEHNAHLQRPASAWQHDALARWEGVLPPGTWKIRAVCSDQRETTAEKVLTLADPGVATVDLTFPPSWPTEGEAVTFDFTGRAASHPNSPVHYVVRQQPGHVSFSGTTIATAGLCVATRKLPPGKYSVDTSIGGIRDQRTFTVVAGAGPTRVTFE